MTINRFNWDAWDVIATSTGVTAGDLYRSDFRYVCSSEIPGTSAGTTSTPTIIPELSGCDLQMPPLIGEFNIIPSAEIEIRLYGNGIY
jgi:hypothetical protein